MDCSFTTSGDWFVFDVHTGRTLKTGFKSKTLALAWIALQLRDRVQA